MKLILVVLGLFLISSTSGDSGFDDEYINLIMQLGEQPNKDTQSIESRAETGTSRARFNCQVGASAPAATSVNKLRPSDINVIGAIGDSLTAANGAKASTILGLLEECRGVSWSMGGESNDVNGLLTLANIIRQFNPKVHGFSTGSGNYKSGNAYFNLAQPGHTSHEMYQQAVDLVNRIKSSSQVDFYNSWKLITFFVGGNDLCKSCNDIKKYSVEQYINNIIRTLDYLDANLPKTLVNLVLTLDVVGIEDLPGTTCRNMQNTLCKCGLDSSFRAKINELTKGYQSGVENLVASGRYDNKEDFTVVLQPFMKLMRPPKKVGTNNPDYSYFAPDCFHLSKKGHQAMAVELWNSMVTPVGQKAEKWIHLDQDVKCPTDSAPYIFTNKNSRAATLRDLLSKH